jgi:HEPN domain-containing protein
MNITAAKEWLEKVWHDLSSSKILYEANHYTDSIGVDLHYAIEKSLKTILAYQNRKIPKTHDLLELNEMVQDYVRIDEKDIYFLHVANKYHIEESYPVFGRPLPEREEIKKVMDFSYKLFGKVCLVLDIDKQEVMN